MMATLRERPTVSAGTHTHVSLSTRDRAITLAHKQTPKLHAAGVRLDNTL